MKVAHRSLLIFVTMFCIVLMLSFDIIHAQEVPRSPQHQATSQQKLAFVSTGPFRRAGVHKRRRTCGCCSYPARA